jgi:phage-related minor tail protein
MRVDDLDKSYAQILNLTEFKSKKMKGEISELVEIHKNTQDKISEALKGFSEYLTNEQRKTCELTDIIIKLESHIKQLESLFEKYIKIDKDIDKMHETIKQKTTIIVNRDKPKNHKMNLEEK